MTLVRPTLEYASFSWNPQADTDIKRLAQIQKNAALFVCNDHNIATSTSSLVKSLGRDTLEHRRLFNQSALFFFIKFIIQQTVNLLVQLNLPTKSGLLHLTNLPIANYRQMSQFSIIHFSQGYQSLESAPLWSYVIFYIKLFQAVCFACHQIT